MIHGPTGDGRNASGSSPVYGPLNPPPAEKRPRYGRNWTVAAVVILGMLAAAFFIGRSGGIETGVKQERDRVAAVSASAAAPRSLPPGLYCPERDSDEAAKAIKDKPVVTIDQSPTDDRTVVMRKAVVVVVNARVTHYLIVCGNDASVVLQVPLDDTASLYIEGGHDDGAPGAGPAVYMVDDVAQPDTNRVFFSNKKPLFVRCAAKSPITPERARPCDSYYSTVAPTSAPPTPRVSTTTKR